MYEEYNRNIEIACDKMRYMRKETNQKIEYDII